MDNGTISEEAMNWSIKTPQAITQNIFTNSTPLADGNWTLQCTAFDGLTNSTALNGSLLIDSVAPSSTISAVKFVSGNPYTFGTISHESLNFTLYCDDLTGIGCNMTQYCFDTTNTCSPNTTYASTFAYTVPGLQYIRFRSNDTYNNTEAIQTRNFTINHIPVVASVKLNSTTNDSSAVVKFYCNGTDSDANTLTYYWTLWKNGVENLTLSNGTYAQGIEKNLWTITTDQLTDGDFWTASCTVYDGFENSTTVNSSALGLSAYVYTTYAYANEKTAKDFWINFTVPATSVLFYFDGTYYPMTNIGGNTWYLSYTLPAVAGDTNYTYGYNWTIFGGTNLVTSVINVLNTEITSNCSGKSPALYINYLDEKNTTNDISNGMNLEIIFTVTFPDGTYEYVSFNTTNATTVCVNNGTNITVLAQMLYYNTGWAQRTHYLGYLTPFYLSDVQQNITLYSLNSSFATPITYTVYNWNGEPYKNAYLDIERFYTSSNSYQSISVSRTDNDGIATIYLEPLSAFYKAIVVRDGAIKYTDQQGSVISSASRTIRLNEAVPENIYTGTRGTSSTHTYNATTRVFSATTVFNGLTGTAQLNVIKSGMMGDTLNCSQNGTGSSVTLFCTLPNTTGTSYKVSLSTNTTEGTWLLFTDTITDPNSTYKTDALISIIMVVMSLTFFFMRTPEFAIVGNLLGLWICFGMGLFAVGTLTAASLVGLTFAGIVVWVAIRK